MAFKGGGINISQTSLVSILLVNICWNVTYMRFHSTHYLITCKWWDTTLTHIELSSEFSMHFKMTQGGLVFFLDFPFLPPIRLSKNPMRNTRPFGGHVPAKITQEETQSGRRPCQLCKTKGERTPNGGAVMTRYKCTECQVPLCSGDRRHCFFVYHRDRFPAMALSGAGEQRPASFSVSNQPELSPFRKQNYQS